MDVNDISLVTQVVVHRNKRAFDQLVRKYQSPLRRFFLNLTLGDGQLADDLAQDTFVRAYTHLDTFQMRASFSSWLYRIAYNVFYDYKRRRNGVQEGGLEAANGAQALLNAPVARQNEGLRQDLHQALGILSEQERMCVTLQLVDGFAIAEIAGIMEMPENTVKSHLLRGKRKLTDYLKQNGYGRK